MNYTLFLKSGGNGRTAVLLAVVIAMDQANNEGKIDLKGVVSELRRQRMNMVQTEVIRWLL